MRTRFLVIPAILVTFAVTAPRRVESVASTASTDSAAAFARLKTLAGDWEATTKGMGKVRVTYEVVADGTTVLERFSAEKMPAMVTMYHRDGGRLLLTHYCMAGNQPRMEAKSYDAKSGELIFDFLDATNLASPSAGHMHAVTFRFVDARSFSSTWTFYESGKAKFAEAATYTRIP